MEFAAAFVDYEIPTQKGPAIITQLKKHNPNCLVALVTSADSSQYKENGEAAGAEAFICTGWPLDRVETELNMLLAEWNSQIH